MIVEVDRASKSLKGIKVLDEVSLTFCEGNFYGIQGRNGSGKTMLLRAISGLIHLSSGRISIDGQELGHDISFPPSIGVLIEASAFIGKYTGFKNLKLLASIKGLIEDKEIREILERVGLDPYDKRVFHKYSLGMKQRLGIACALMENPELILLDEPFSALDDAGVILIRDLLRERREAGAIIILTSHDKEEMEGLSDEIITMENGRISGHRPIERDR